jgi:hypothetical protein
MYNRFPSRLHNPARTSGERPKHIFRLAPDIKALLNKQNADQGRLNTFA